MEAPPLRSDTRDARVLLQANGACHLSDELFYHAELTCSVVNHLELVETIATATTLEWKFSDGRTVSYPRDPIDIGNLTFSYTQTANGKYFYKYTLDNRLVQMIRIGEFDHDLLGGILHRGAQPILRGPDGWTDLGIGWLPSREDPVTRCETAKYTILSNFLPGPLPLHVAGAEKVRDDFQLPFKGRNSWERHLIQQIDITIRQYGTSADPLVIGPAFTPNPTENEVRDRIHRLVELDGFDFLRPLDDATVNLVETQCAVVPGTDFELQILDCLKVASLSAENWQLIDTASYGPDIRRRFTCQAGNHRLRADVWTDFVDEKIEGISLQLVVQVVVRYQDGSEQPRMLDGNLVTLMLDQEWKLGESLLRFPSM
jgi:hypothetical protein